MRSYKIMVAIASIFGHFGFNNYKQVQIEVRFDFGATAQNIFT